MTSATTYTKRCSASVWSIRADIGGMQTLLKYKHLFFKKGMLGSFIIPLFSLSMFLGVFGLGFFLYLIIKRFLFSYLVTKYALYGGASVLSLQDFSFAPSIMNFFAVALFFLGFWFTIFGLSVISGRVYIKKHSLLNLGLYLILYLAIFPIVLMGSLIKFITGRYGW